MADSIVSENHHPKWTPSKRQPAIEQKGEWFVGGEGEGAIEDWVGPANGELDDSLWPYVSG